jgi:hypothetical protein
MAGWSDFRTYRGHAPTESVFRIFGSSLISKDESSRRRVGTEELCDEQMFEFGASHKAVLCCGLRTSFREGQ